MLILSTQLSLTSCLFYCSLKCCGWGAADYSRLRRKIMRVWRQLEDAPVAGGAEEQVAEVAVEVAEVAVEPYAAALFDLPPLLLRQLAARRARAMLAMLRGLTLPRPTPSLSSLSSSSSVSQLRVGYLSADLLSHSVGFLMQGVPLLHDRRKVQVLCFRALVEP